MSFEAPTYEEYQKATAWAKFKYKYGIVVLVLCWVALLFLFYYVYINAEALAINPFVYAAAKYDVECYCYKPYNIGQRMEFYFNGTSLWTTRT